MAGLRSAWLIAPVVAGCNVFFGVDDLELKEARPPANSGTGGTSTGEGGGGEAGTEELGGGGTGGVAGDGGGGSAPVPICGDGAINAAGEQCDDGALVDGDGCSGMCQVECTGPNLFMHPTTLHCYRKVTLNDDWLAGSMSCAGWNGALASVTTDEERGFLDPFIATETWIGANDIATEGTYGWENGEPWVVFAWEAGSPENPPNVQDCVSLQANVLFNDRDCDITYDHLCERATGLP